MLFLLLMLPVAITLSDSGTKNTGIEILSNASLEK